jgi:hypothetical protein
MTARPTSIRAGSKPRKLYDRAHLAWRAGAISDFYYGRRSPSDPIVVWLVDGVEYDGKDLAGVASAIDVAFSRVGIADAVFGDAWCGYRSLHVTYTHGSRLTERFDASTGHVVREHRTAGAIVATSEAA